MNKRHDFIKTFDEVAWMAWKNYADNTVDDPYLFDSFDYTHIKFPKWFRIYPNGQVEGPFL